MKQKENEANPEGPYYIVMEGTNLCERIAVSRDTHIPKIFDTEEIAQTYIYERDEYRERVGLTPAEARVTISIAEYNRKYAKLMKIKVIDSNVINVDGWVIINIPEPNAIVLVEDAVQAHIYEVM